MNFLTRRKFLEERNKMSSQDFDRKKKALRKKLDEGVINRRQYTQELRELTFAHANIVNKILMLLNIIQPN